jgi:hypothetical protein
MCELAVSSEVNGNDGAVASEDVSGIAAFGRLILGLAQRLDADGAHEGVAGRMREQAGDAGS